MTVERKKLFEDIGFDFEGVAKEDNWQKMYEHLKTFKVVVSSHRHLLCFKSVKRTAHNLLHVQSGHCHIPAVSHTLIR